MDIFQSFILGIVQGITEWLPISSKSHLFLMQHILNINPPVIYDLILHLGSFVAVLAFFWKDIWDLIIGLWNRDKESWKMAGYIVIATIPVVIIGLIFEKFVKDILNNLFVMGWLFLLTAVIIYLSKYPHVKKNELNFFNSFIIGISQVLALLPGISRSGVTISSGMMLGIKKDVVAKFSFLIFIPTILGATVLELKDIGQVGSISVLIVGFITAAVVGFLALSLLMNIIKKDKFSWFSIYCAVLGIIILLFAYGIV